jgi:hypothetical protein
MSSTRIPTEKEIAAAEEYALKILCLEIPKQFQPGLTYWDDHVKACRISQAGCTNSSPQNPLNQILYTSSGEPIEFEKWSKNPSLNDFWAHRPPDHLAWKVTTSSNNQFVCARANDLLYRWCQFPNTRVDSNGYGYSGLGWNVGRFQYTNRNGKESCIIPKSYCDEKGVDYDGTPGHETCFVSGIQAFGELITGSVLVRMANAGT